MREGNLFEVPFTFSTTKVLIINELCKFFCYFFRIFCIFCSIRQKISSYMPFYCLVS